MADLKTRPTAGSIEHLLDAIDDPVKQADARAVLAMMKQATGQTPRLWGSSIVGFGDHHYVYETGREGDWFQVGFAPRKTSLVLYGLGFGSKPALMKKLGAHKTGVGCLYIRQLSGVDSRGLRRL